MRKYKSKGLVILGFDASDDKKIALEMLRDNGATFPNIIDSSDAAMKVCFQQYQGRYGSAVPMNYIIDRDGKVVDAWYGGGRRAPAGHRGHAKDRRASWPRRSARMRTTKRPRSAPEVAAAAQRLFQVLRDADYDHDGISTRDWKHYPAKEINYNPDRNDPGLGALGVQEVQDKSHHGRSTGQRLCESQRRADRPFRVAPEGWRDSPRRFAVLFYGLGRRRKAMGRPGRARLALAPAI